MQVFEGRTVGGFTLFGKWARNGSFKSACIRVRGVYARAGRRIVVTAIIGDAFATISIRRFSRRTAAAVLKSFRRYRSIVWYYFNLVQCSYLFAPHFYVHNPGIHFVTYTPSQIVRFVFIIWNNLDWLKLFRRSILFFEWSELVILRYNMIKYNKI